MSLLVAVDQDIALVPNLGNSQTVAVDQDICLLVQQRLVPAVIETNVDQEVALLIVKRNNVSFTFLDPSGNPLANGMLELWLNVDASADGNWISANRTVTVPLDITGSCSLNLWTNDVLSPTGTCYNGVVTTAEGQPVWEQQFTVATGGFVTVRV